jgi:hypothetical protein
MVGMAGTSMGMVKTNEVQAREGLIVPMARVPSKAKMSASAARLAPRMSGLQN